MPSQFIPRVGWICWSYDARHASARIRCLEPLQILRAQGLPCERFRSSAQNKYDIVVFSKIYTTAHLELARELKTQGKHLVFDLSDNRFYHPEPNSCAEEDLSRLREMVALADLVSVPTGALASVVGKKARVVPDGIAPLGARWPYWESRAREFETELLWFGNWGGTAAHGGMKDVVRIREPLENRALKHSLRLTICSNNAALFNALFGDWQMPVRYQEWSSDISFRRQLEAGRFDVAVLPINKNPFTICKSNNRLALALFHRVAVIADAIPAYQEFRDFCVLDDWEGGLKRYLESEESRKEDALRGRSYVQENYSAQRAANQWWQLFESLASTENILQ